MWFKEEIAIIEKNEPILLIATNNAGKLIEIAKILNLPNIKLISLQDIQNPPAVTEDCRTYEENALKKASTYYKHSKIMSLADDSGLEIDYLQGTPGVHSARYMGTDTSYNIKCKKIVEMMQNAPPEMRGARFRCVAALVTGAGTFTVEGVCEGTISREAKGAGGFGYDPIFIPNRYTETFAELPSEIKNNISHRFIAMRKMRDIMLEHKIF